METWSPHPQCGCYLITRHSTKKLPPLLLKQQLSVYLYFFSLSPSCSSLICHLHKVQRTTQQLTDCIHHRLLSPMGGSRAHPLGTTLLLLPLLGVTRTDTRRCKGVRWLHGRYLEEGGCNSTQAGACDACVLNSSCLCGCDRDCTSGRRTIHRPRFKSEAVGSCEGPQRCSKKCRSRR